MLEYMPKTLQHWHIIFFKLCSHSWTQSPKAYEQIHIFAHHLHEISGFGIDFFFGGRPDDQVACHNFGIARISPIPPEDQGYWCIAWGCRPPLPGWPFPFHCHPPSTTFPRPRAWRPVMPETDDDVLPWVHGAKTSVLGKPSN